MGETILKNRFVANKKRLGKTPKQAKQSHTDTHPSNRNDTITPKLYTMVFKKAFLLFVMGAVAVASATEVTIQMRQRLGLRGGAPTAAQQTRAEWIKKCESMTVADGDFLLGGLKALGLSIAKQKELEELPARLKTAAEKKAAEAEVVTLAILNMCL